MTKIERGQKTQRGGENCLSKGLVRRGLLVCKVGVMTDKVARVISSVTGRTIALIFSAG